MIQSAKEELEREHLAEIVRRGFRDKSEPCTYLSPRLGTTLVLSSKITTKPPQFLVSRLINGSIIHELF